MTVCTNMLLPSCSCESENNVDTSEPVMFTFAQSLFLRPQRFYQLDHFYQKSTLDSYKYTIKSTKRVTIVHFTISVL